MILFLAQKYEENALFSFLGADEHASEGLVNKFFEELGGGSPDELAEASAAGDDAEHERQEHVRPVFESLGPGGEVWMRGIGMTVGVSRCRPPWRSTRSATRAGPSKW